MELSFSRRLWIFSAVCRCSSGGLIRPASRVLPSLARTVPLLVLLECSSRQKGSRPMSARRFCTTLRAAIFSATKRTDLPWNRALAIMLVMVWDLPVPGGPCRTKLSPWAAAVMATIWEESALTGMAMSDRDTQASSSWAEIFSWPGSQFIRPSMRLATTLLRLISSARLRISFHMTNWPKENRPRKAISSTFHRFFAITACRMVWNTRRRSTPCSSSGRGSRPEMRMPWSCRRYSSSVTFIWTSSWRLRITKPLLRTLLTISTDSSTRGAYLAFSDTLVSYQRRKPRARNRVLEPFSSMLILAERYRPFRRLSSSASLRKVRMRLLLNSWVAMVRIRSFWFSISNIWESRRVSVHSEGISRMRKSFPSDNWSSSSHRSAAMSWKAFFVTRKFSRVFRRLKSNSFRSQSFCLVRGSIPSPSTTRSRRDWSRAKGACADFRLLPGVPSSASWVSWEGNCRGIGRIPLLRVLWMSMTQVNCSGGARRFLACCMARSKLSFLPDTKAVHSTRRSSSAPAAVRFSMAETSSTTQSAKVSSSR